MMSYRLSPEQKGYLIVAVIVLAAVLVVVAPIALVVMASTALLAWSLPLSLRKGGRR